MPVTASPAPTAKNCRLFIAMPIGPDNSETVGSDRRGCPWIEQRSIPVEVSGPSHFQNLKRSNYGYAFQKLARPKRR